LSSEFEQAVTVVVANANIVKAASARRRKFMIRFSSVPRAIVSWCWV
jgi:hypothetical protein